MNYQTKKENENKVMKYLKSKKYEMAKASEPNKHLVYIPYAEHGKVSNYLKKHNTIHKLRFNHDYTTAIYCI